MLITKSRTIDQIDSYIDDILSQAKNLEWAGMSFNRLEWCKLRISMKVKNKSNKNKYFIEIINRYKT